MINLFISRLNALSFFIPLASFFKSKNIDFRFLLLLCREDKKYNSLGLSHNSNYIINLLENNKFNFKIISSFDEVFQYDVSSLFSLEGNGITNSIEKRKFKHILIQNYHDFSFSMQYPKTSFIYENADVMWFQNDFFSNLATKIGFKGEKLVSTLPYFWLYQNRKKDEIKKLLNAEDKKIATCFLPRPKETIMKSWQDVKYTPWKTFKSGNPEIDIQHALSLSKHLENKDYFVIQKQRRKNQHPKYWDIYKNYVEDFRWFPNVSLDLMVASDLCFGYMTSAIMDGMVLGKRYLNFSKTKYPPITEQIFEEYRNYQNISSCDVGDDFDNLNFDNTGKINLTDNIFNSKEKVFELLNNG